MNLNKPDQSVEINSLRNRTNSLAKQIIQQQNVFNEYIETNNTNIASILDIISNLSQRVTVNETNIANILGSISNLGQRVTVNETNIQNIDNRVTSNEGDIQNIDNRVTINEGDVFNITTQITNIYNDFTTIVNQIQVIEQNITVNATNIGLNSTQIININADISAVQSDVNVIQTEVNQIQGEVTALEQSTDNGLDNLTELSEFLMLGILPGLWYVQREMAIITNTEPVPNQVISYGDSLALYQACQGFINMMRDYTQNPFKAIDSDINATARKNQPWFFGTGSDPNIKLRFDQMTIDMINSNLYQGIFS